MTALYMDGFDHYGVLPSTATHSTVNFPVLNMLDGTWAQIDHSDPIGGVGFTVQTPPWGSAATGPGCLRNQGATSSTLARYVLSAGQTKLFMSFRFSMDSLPSTTDKYVIADVRDNSNAVLFSLGLTSTGQVSIFSGAQSSVIATTSGPVLRAQTWHFLEMEFDTSGGSFILRVDDSQGSNTPAITTSIGTGGTIAQVAFGNYLLSTSVFIPMNWDDLFIRNGSGSFNNTFLGDRRISTLFPDSDTSTAGWTPSYYKEFGPGILSLATIMPNYTTPNNPNAYISTPSASALDIGSSDFTLETMVRFDALPGASAYSAIFNRWDSANNRRSYRLIYGGSAFNGSSLQLDTSTDGTASTLQTPIVYPWSPVANQWYHVALVRAAGELLLFVNGQQFGVPIADSRTYFSGGTEVLSIGAEVQGASTIVANTNFIGRMDETRFTNGVGRYTGPFTPPVAAFPRGMTDPDWSSVVLLAGYDSGIIDESSYGRLLNAFGGAVSFLPSDGPAVGAYSTVNKAVPDDNTFISASLVSATSILTMTTQPANTNTVTVGTKDGTTAAVYTFKTSITTAFDVLIDTTAQGSLINLLNAINAGTGSGTKYGTGTTANFDVVASQLPVGQIEVTASTAGTAGNSVVTSRTGTAASWPGAHLTGGANIPGPSNFKFQRPPPNTTIVSAMQTVVRALKTDAGTAVIQTALIGPLGGTETGATHNLSVSPDYYSDMIETDPDTSAGLTPTTIINGLFQINRTA